MAQTFLHLGMQFGTGFDNLEVQVSVEAGSSESSIPTLAAIPYAADPQLIARLLRW